MKRRENISNQIKYEEEHTRSCSQTSGLPCSSAGGKAFYAVCLKRARLEKIPPLFFIISGMLFIIYFLSVTFYMGYFNAFNALWLFLGCAAIALGFLRNHMRAIVKRMKKRLKIPLIISVGSFCLCFIITEMQIVYNMKSNAEQHADYVIILGARVNGNIPSLAMARRTHAALSYMRSNKHTKAIASGGQGEGEAISEAEAIARILQNNNFGTERIIIENKSMSTFENLKHCMRLIDSPSSRVVIATSEFHICRVKLIAKRLGYKNYTALSSRTPLILLPNYMLREFLAIWAALCVKM